LRKRVNQRAKGCCEYCMSQEKFESSSFSIEHIVPKSKGGTNDFENLAFSCQGCNNFKFTKLTAVDPITKTIVPLFNPRKDNWTDHFEWNENFSVILGKTPIGRAMIIALKMNREFLINQRIVYRAYGIHPPEHSLKN